MWQAIAVIAALALVLYGVALWRVRNSALHPKRYRDQQSKTTHARRIAQAGWKRIRRKARNLRWVYRGGILARVKLRKGKTPRLVRVFNPFAKPLSSRQRRRLLARAA